MELKMAGCSAPKRGHHSLSAVLACPFHSKDEYTLGSLWKQRGVNNFSPADSGRVSPRSGLPVYMGPSPRVGSHNVGMEITGEQLEEFCEKSTDAQQPVALENCRITPTREPGTDATVSARDYAVDFYECNFRSVLGIRGDMATVEGGSVYGYGVVRLGGGALAAGITMNDGTLTVDSGAAAQDCRCVDGQIVVSTGGIVESPVWATKDVVTHLDSGERQPDHVMKIIGEPESVSIEQPGWVIVTSDGKRPPKSVVYPEGRTFISKDQGTRQSLTLERVMATTLDGDGHGGGYIAADNDIAWGLYLEMRASRAPSLTIEPFGVDFGLAVSPN